MAKRILVDRQNGRFGNTLYRISNIISFGLDHGINVWDASLHVSGYSKQFPRIRKRLFLSFPRSPLLPLSIRWLHLFQAKLIRFLGHGDKYMVDASTNFWSEYVLKPDELFEGDRETVILRGFHYNADDSVRRHAPKLRQLLSPEKKVSNQAKRLASHLKNDDALLVAVHLRLDDFKDWKDGKFFFDLNYYRSAMESTAKAFAGQKVKFIIFSDEPELDQSVFSGLDFLRLEKHSTMEFDWVMMSHCDYIISPLYSTYSGWASFYGETPIFRLNGKNRPESPSDFCFDPVLNNSQEFNKSLEA